MRSIRRTILSLVALIGLGAALGGCTTTERMLGTGAVIGVTAGATNAVVSRMMADEYRPAGYYGGGYAGGLRPGKPCTWRGPHGETAPGVLRYNPNSEGDLPLTCECLSPRPMYAGGYRGGPNLNAPWGGSPAYGYRGPMYRPPMYRRW